MSLATHAVFTREEWARLRSNVPLTLSEADLNALRGAYDFVSIREVEEIYLPLTRLLNLHIGQARGLARVTDDFLGQPAAPKPYVIAVAGSVAVGKSTFARILRELLARWPDHPSVELVTTDGFLFPNTVLDERGIAQRKGFPESYDVKRMIAFLADVKLGKRAMSPVYSHVAYDIVPGEEQVVDCPDILVFEGINVLQLPPDGRAQAVTASDFFDFTIYIDAEEKDIEAWYVERFLTLQRTAFGQPDAFFHRFHTLNEEQARSVAQTFWGMINSINLRENIEPTRPRADLVVRKRADHGVEELWLKR
jgi:type I pantothenate kinase